jgi:hypothetical protein
MIGIVSFAISSQHSIAIAFSVKTKGRSTVGPCNADLPFHHVLYILTIYMYPPVSTQNIVFHRPPLTLHTKLAQRLLTGRNLHTNPTATH